MIRGSRIILLALLILGLSGWQPGRKVAPTSPAFEQSLTDSGLHPLDEYKTAALLGNATVYGTHMLTGQKWIEYYDHGGAVVRTKISSEPVARNAGRPMLFGTWWGEGDDICFAYGLKPSSECYRLYYRNGSLLYIQAKSSRKVPAGALLGFSTDIRKGDVEDFPLIGD
ncbi:MAG: hypothetical protein JSU82_10825 [Rhodospirillales bacterium]|nr:MAG: hypothetical protein JSU82_10825 [Rhodospirillales bacterium]